MSRVLNVTPSEYVELKELAAFCAMQYPDRYDDVGWFRGASNILGVKFQPYSSFEVVCNWTLERIPSCYYGEHRGMDGKRYECGCAPHVSRFAEEVVKPKERK